MVVAASCCGLVFHQQGLGDWSGLRERWIEQSTKRSSMEICSTLLRASDWAKGSPSNMTMTLSTQPGQHTSGSGTTLWMCFMASKYCSISCGRTTFYIWKQVNLFGQTWFPFIFWSRLCSNGLTQVEHSIILAKKSESSSSYSSSLILSDDT